MWVMEVLIDVVISQISDCSNEKVATIATTINSNDDCVAFITLSLEKKVPSLRISQDDVVETEYGVLMEADRSFDDAGGSRNESGERKSGRTNLSPTYDVRAIKLFSPRRPSQRFHRLFQLLSATLVLFLISSFPCARIDFNEEFKRQETFDLGRGRRRDFRKRRTTDAFSVKLLVVASSLVNLRGKQVLTVRTSKTSPRNSNGMQLYVGASTGPKPSPDTRTLK
ncbi:hypothetical protein HZH68_012218 [Vespula germanica]|uniref:Uncharacterized protein n=1 Tax=Vespula germanica TaxID=30212 RepID=A0A834JMV2_VESGE|nr:hypothetical protein HZH68_012218 [Vespula germanica]